MALHWQPVGSDPLSEFASETADATVPSRQLDRSSASRTPQPPPARPNDAVDTAVVMAVAVLVGAAGYAVFLLTR